MPRRALALAAALWALAAAPAWAAPEPTAAEPEPTAAPKPTAAEPAPTAAEPEPTAAPAPTAAEPEPTAAPAPTADPPLAADRARAEALARAAGADPARTGQLLAAARLFEQRLHDPARAAKLYRQVVALAPDGAEAEAARRRLDFLAPLLAGEPPALRTWLAIRRSEGREPAATSVARAEALLAAHPGWPGAAHVELWLGDQARGVGDWNRARAHYRRALAGGARGELARAVHRSRVQLALSGGDPGEAAAALAELRALGPLDPGERVLRDRALLELRRAAWARAAWIGTAAALVLLLASLAAGAGSPRRALRALWPPPTEILYLAPPLALVLGLALLRFRDVAAALAAMSAAGLAYAWLSAAGLRASRPTRWRAAVHSLATAAGVAAAVYLVLYQTELLTDLLDTIDTE